MPGVRGSSFGFIFAYDKQMQPSHRRYKQATFFQLVMSGSGQPASCAARYHFSSNHPVFGN